MNLTKLFNYKYLMQNIKKSKMAITLFLLVVPIFTSLFIITAFDSYAPSFIELGAANIIFMYVTPFILSFSLFGYVYKKKSIDFIGSMPISRKSIFITNTIGGIALIILMQLITLICTLLFSSITNSLIFSKMVLDLFIYQTVAYIFVFVVSNLAMSVSGNVVTQIVVTLLILFTVSASIFYLNISNNSFNVSFNPIGQNYDLKKDINYTAPSLIFNGDYQYNVKSMIKMILLSIAYIILGFNLFKNKKMEYAGESFENKNTHFIVKGLTLIPFVMILVLLFDSHEWEAIIILLTIMAVYFLVYDLITNKRNKIKDNFCAFIISITVLFGAYEILINITEDVKIKVDLDDIKSFTITRVDYNNIATTKSNDISLLEKLAYNAGDYREGKDVKIELNLKNGDKGQLRFYYTKDSVIEEVLSSMETPKVSNSTKIKFRYYDYNEIEITKQEEKELKNALNKAFETISAYELYNINEEAIDGEYFIIYDYKDHDIIEYNCSIKLTKEVFDVISRIYSRKLNEKIAKINRTGEFANIKILNSETLKKYMPEDFKAEKYYYYVGNYSNTETEKEILNFVYNNLEKTCNLDEEYIGIQISNLNFYTNDVEEFAKILEKYYKIKNKNDNDYDYDYEDIAIPDTEAVDEVYTQENIINMNPNSSAITIGY